MIDFLVYSWHNLSLIVIYFRFYMWLYSVCEIFFFFYIFGCVGSLLLRAGSL